MPFIVGMMGRSNVGKTTLILKLIPELTSRGYKVGTVKNCVHGFNINKEGKDSYKFSKEGSKGVLLTSPEEIAFIRKKENGDIIRTINLLFSSFDIILVEGFSKEQRLRRIEVLRKGVDEQVISPSEELIAVISDVDVKTSKPVFKPNEVSKIVDFLERVMNEGKKKCKESIDVIVNGQRVFLNGFLQSMVKSLTLAIVSPLKREDKGNIKEVMIKVTDNK